MAKKKHLKAELAQVYADLAEWECIAGDFKTNLVNAEKHIHDMQYQDSVREKHINSLKAQVNDLNMQADAYKRTIAVVNKSQKDTNDKLQDAYEAMEANAVLVAECDPSRLSRLRKLVKEQRNEILLLKQKLEINAADIVKAITHGS